MITSATQITSSFRKGFLYFIVLFVILCGIGFLIPLYFAFFYCPYVQLDYIAFISIPFYFFLAGLHSTRRYFKKIEIVHDRITVGNSTSYRLKDIERYALFHQKDKYFSWEELHVFFTDGSTLFLSSLSYKNFEELKEILTNDKENITQSYLKQNLKKMWIYLAIALVSAAGIIYGIEIVTDKAFPSKNYSSKDLITLRSVLAEDPEIYSNRTYLTLKSFPGFDFSFSTYDIDREAFRKDVHKNDSIFIYVLKDVYKGKLSSDAKPDFEMKHFEYDDVWIYGISDMEYIYFEPGEELSISYPSDVKINFIFLVGFSFFFAMISILLYYGYSLKTGKN